MSQGFNVGPSFSFMKSRKIIIKNNLDLPIFLTTVLRHGFLQMNILTMPTRLEVCIINNKKVIFDQNIKVKKSVLNFYF